MATRQCLPSACHTGELGWEIFVTPDFAEHVAEILIQEGQSFGLKLVGGEALNALRIEMGFVHWGHEMAHTEAPHQLGFGFACKNKQVHSSSAVTPIFLGEQRVQALI